MKLKLLLVLVFYGSSAYALQTAYWDNFLKAFNDYKSQVSITHEAQKALGKKNNKFIDEVEAIRPALWIVQKNKSRVDKKLDRIDDITADDLINELLDTQGKEAIEPIRQDLTAYFNKLIDSIKKAKILAQTYNELMSAPDDAPPSLSRQIISLKEKAFYKQTGSQSPQGIQVSVSWKKKAEKMLNDKCLTEVLDKKTLSDKKSCRDYFEFKEGASIYVAKLEKAAKEGFEEFFSDIVTYREMKKQMVELLESLKNSISQEQFDKLQKNSDTCKTQSKQYADKIKDLKDKNKNIKSAIESAIVTLNDPKTDYKKTIEDLKVAYDKLYPSKSASSKP